ncbi:MAG: hypothetical protein M0Q13_12235, partial [Methanothrix sp.]|nr:hypothetical protein [Methanothrix sp.]
MLSHEFSLFMLYHGSTLTSIRIAGRACVPETPSDFLPTLTDGASCFDEPALTLDIGQSRRSVLHRLSPSVRG